MLLSNCYHKRTEIIFHKYPRDSMAACSMVNYTFLKGRGETREAEKWDSHHLVTCTVNMKPCSPNVQEGSPKLFMNCPTRLSSSETIKLFCILCVISFYRNQEQRHSFLFSQKGHSSVLLTELKSLQLYGIFTDQIHKSQAHILTYVLLQFFAKNLQNNYISCHFNYQI